MNGCGRGQGVGLGVILPIDNAMNDWGRGQRRDSNIVTITTCTVTNID